MRSPNPAASRPFQAPDNEHAWRHHMMRWGAIAYSVSTRRSGLSYGYGDQAGAEQAALSACGARDAFIVISAADHLYLALATASDGAWGSGWSTDQNAAQRIALNNCAGVAGRHIQALVHPQIGILHHDP